METSNDKNVWTKVASGTWDHNDTKWQVVTFNSPVTARYVRLVGVKTWSNGHESNTDMSLSELRAMQPSKDLKQCTITAEPVVMESVSETNPALVNPVIKDGDKTLSYGYDYTLKFQNNTAFGTGTVIATGIGAYTGTLQTTFEIKAAVSITDLVVKTQPSKMLRSHRTGSDRYLQRWHREGCCLLCKQHRIRLRTFSDYSADHFSSEHHRFLRWQAGRDSRYREPVCCSF